jgi:hypothetical protein
MAKSGKCQVFIEIFVGIKWHSVNIELADFRGCCKTTFACNLHLLLDNSHLNQN